MDSTSENIVQKFCDSVVAIEKGRNSECIDFNDLEELGFREVFQKIFDWTCKQPFAQDVPESPFFENEADLKYSEFLMGDLTQVEEETLIKAFEQSPEMIHYLAFDYKLRAKVMQNMKFAFERNQMKETKHVFTKSFQRGRYRYFLAFPKKHEPVTRDQIPISLNSFSIYKPFQDMYLENKRNLEATLTSLSLTSSRLSLVPSRPETPVTFEKVVDDFYGVNLNKICRIFLGNSGVYSRITYYDLEENLEYESPT